MDARLLDYYKEELRYLREQGAEFAKAFPRIAARLGMESLEVSDPYVERLLEGCAFLAARIQLKQDSEFPRFSNRLLELIYPNFLAPIPSMLIAQVVPSATADPSGNRQLPAQTSLSAPRSELGPTRCEFRTAWPVDLVPLQTASADYFLNVGELGLTAWSFPARPRCGTRIRLRSPAGADVAALGIDGLRFFIGGQKDVALKVQELIDTALTGVLVGPPGRAGNGQRRMLPHSAVRITGFDDDQAMLPPNPRTLAGTRLVQEYFAFPERFLFFDIDGLAPALAAVAGSEVEIILLFSRQSSGLDGLVDASTFALNCVPAINLFPKRADRITLGEGAYDFHVVPDRAAPLDYEVFDVLELSGADTTGQERRFLPLFAPDHSSSSYAPGYYTLWREPRLPSDRVQRDGPRSGYIGTEAFVALVDPNEAPYPAGVRQLSVQTRCTNRDVPLFIPSGSLASGFKLDSAIPIERVSVLAGPSRPHTALRKGGAAWRLINLLSHNYLSLLDTEQGDAAATLRDLLSRFPLGEEPTIRRQIESLQRVSAKAVIRRHPGGGRIAFSRGVEVTLTVDELGHEGGSATLFASVLHHWLARHASLNSYVETVLVSLGRGELARWTPASGKRAVL